MQDLNGRGLGKVIEAGKSFRVKEQLYGRLAVSKLEVYIKFTSAKSELTYYGEYPRDINRFGIGPIEVNPFTNRNLDNFYFEYYFIPEKGEYLEFTKRKLDLGIQEKKSMSLKDFQNGNITVELKFNHFEGVRYAEIFSLSRDTFIQVKSLGMRLDNEFDIFEIEGFKKEEGSNKFTSKIKIRDVN